MKKTLMTLGMMILVVLLFVGCGDNNKGPFGYEYENGQLIVTSANKPAKGMVKYTTTDSRNITRTVYEMELDKGVPTGKITVFDESGTPFIEVDAKKADIGGYPFSYTGTMIIDGGVKVEGDFKIESTEEFFNIFENYGLNIHNRSDVYKYFMNNFMINGTIETESGKTVFQDGRIIEEIRIFGDGRKEEKYWDRDGEPNGTWLATYIGPEKGELKPGTIMYRQTFEHGLKVYSDDEWAVDFNYSSLRPNYRWDSPDGSQHAEYVGYDDMIQFNSYDRDQELTVNMKKDTDGVYRVYTFLLVTTVSKEVVISDDMDISVLKQVLDNIEPTMKEFYPNITFDFNHYHSDKQRI